MKRLIILSLALALTTAAPAFGQSATKDAYGGPASVLSNISRHDTSSNSSHRSNASTSASTDPTPSSSSDGKGTLPFTGFDVVLLAFGSVALVGVGMGVRRLSRPLA